MLNPPVFRTDAEGCRYGRRFQVARNRGRGTRVDDSKHSRTRGYVNCGTPEHITESVRTATVNSETR